jgi:hypothetical protein
MKKPNELAEYLMKDYIANDEPFGVLTRNALEMVMSQCGGSNRIYIIDFKDIHKLNGQIGYEEVNNIIRKCIADLTGEFNGIVVGRVFSGDEIAILDDHYYDRLMENFARICKEYKLGFKWLEAEITLGQSLKIHREHLNNLSQKLQSSQYSKMLWTI